MFNKTIILKLIVLTVIAMSGRYSQAEIIAFENVNIIPMDKREVLNNYRVLVTEGQISHIQPMSSPSTLPVDRTIDCRGKYMMPGLTDIHYHPRGATSEKDAEMLYKLLLANGVTTVVSMGEDGGQDAIATRKHANKKNVFAPIYFTAGPILGHNDLKTQKDAIESVRFHKQRGYDFIKVHEDFSIDTYTTLLHEAEKAGIPVIGHAQRELPLEYTLRLTLIAHMEEIVNIFSDAKNFNIADINEQQAKEIAIDVKRSGVYVSPTLTVLAMIQDYRDDSRFEKLKNRPESRFLSKNEFRNYTTQGKEYRQALFTSTKGVEGVDKLIKGTQQLTKAFYNAGVPLLVGSDNIGLHISGFSMHDEMEAMNKLGIPAFDILNSATVLSARYLKRQAIAGTISVGKNAEFILLSENPLIDIKNTRDVQGVMLKGHWLDKKSLDQFLVDVDVARQLED